MRVFELCYLELSTNPRRDKRLGLKWEGIDLDQDDWPVRRQVGRINGKVVKTLSKIKTPTILCLWSGIRQTFC